MNGIDLVLLAGLLKGVVLAAVAAALGRRADPAARVWLLRGLSATLLMLPLLTVLAVSSGFAPSFSLPALAEGTEPPPAAVVLAPPELTVPLVQPRPAGPWLLAAWLAGISLAAGGLLRQLLVLRRWHRQASFVGRRRAGSRRVWVGWSDAVTSPVSFGWRSPVVLLPVGWRDHPDITAQDVDHALAHELAHVERGDWPWLMTSRLAAAVHWCNPLLPRLSRLLAEDTEIACDRRALGLVSDTAGYARTLLKAMDVGRALQPGNGSRHDTGPALAMAGTAQWRRRIEHLYHRETPMTVCKLRLTLAAALALPLTLVQLSHAETPAPQAPAQAPAPDGVVAPDAARAPAVPEPVAPDTPVSPAAAPAMAPAPGAVPRAEASPAPEDRAAARRAEVARRSEQAQAMREAERAEADRLRAQARAARDTDKAEARAARDAARARRDELRASHDETRIAQEEVRRANQEALAERERLSRQLAELQARMAEIEAELAAARARNSER